MGLYKTLADQETNNDSLYQQSLHLHSWEGLHNDLNINEKKTDSTKKILKHERVS